MAPVTMTEEQLQRLINGARTGTPSGPNANVPFAYRAIQQAPQITGSQNIDAILGLIAPLIGRGLGMQNPMFLPQPTPAGAWAGFYGRDVTTPLSQAMTEQTLYQAGGMFGQQLSNIGTNLGLNRALGMSVGEFQENLVNAGQTQAGRMVTQAIMQTDAMQNIMGGDVLGMQNQIFANRQSFGAMPGMPVAPMDIQGQTAVTQHASQFSQELMRAIYTNPRGEATLLPNLGVTRGFRVEDIGGMATAMAARGSSTMRGLDIDPRAKVDAVARMARVMEAVSTVIESRDMGQIISTLDSMTNKQWANIDPGRLEQSFREMSAMSNTLGVGMQQVFGTVASVQQGMQQMVGVTPELARLGYTGGGAGSLPMATQMTQRILGIQQATGQPLEQVQAQQMGLMNMMTNSEQGRDISMVEWMRQTGKIAPEQYEAFRNSMRFGSKANQQTMVNRMYEQAFGSAGIGQQMRNDPTMLRSIQRELDSGAWSNATGAMTDAMLTETGQRTMEVGVSRLAATNSRIAASAGIQGNMPASERARLQYETMRAFIQNNAPDGEVGSQLAILEQDVAAAGGLGNAGAAMRAMQMTGRNLFDEGQQTNLKDATSSAEAVANRQRLGTIAPAMIQRRAQLGVLGNMARFRQSRSGRSELAAMRQQLGKIDELHRSGASQRRISAATRQYDKMMRNLDLTDEQAGLVQRRGVDALEAAETGDLRRGEAQAEYLRSGAAGVEAEMNTREAMRRSGVSDLESGVEDVRTYEDAIARNEAITVDQAILQTEMDDMHAGLQATQPQLITSVLSGDTPISRSLKLQETAVRSRLKEVDVKERPDKFGSESDIAKKATGGAAQVAMMSREDDDKKTKDSKSESGRYQLTGQMLLVNQQTRQTVGVVDMSGVQMDPLGGR